MSLQTVQNWLESFAATALRRDLAGHMAHISEAVQVFGVPGIEVLGYGDWERQCAHEFPQGLIRDLQYSDLRLRTATDTDLLFVVNEYQATADGQRLQQPLEMLLTREDNAWHLRQLRILDPEEARHQGLSAEG